MHPQIYLQGFNMPKPVKPKTYCDAVKQMCGPELPFHKACHDVWHGFPAKDDDELFARLMLEVNQAGLSWTTVLKKEKSFYKAYDQFKIKKVAAYTLKDRARLMKDAGIIRNRLKINAAIENAKTVIQIQKEHGSFKNWLDKEYPKPIEEWVKLFRKTFKFVGYEIVNEFLMSTGYLRGAHHEKCEIYPKVARLKPAWMSKALF
jgi:DNA-3-methyladenine glycosylase I